MKKYVFVAMLLMSCTCMNAQYKPTQKDVGKDCTTADNKIGTWKNVTVTENVSNTKIGSQNSTSTQSLGVSGKVNANLGVASGSVSGSSNNSNSYGTSNSSSTTNTTTRTYDDIQCVEDKNANLPQRSPKRW